MLELDIRARLQGFVLDIALQTQNGEILGLFGPSGTGKSLTLRAVAGLLRPEAGRIVLNGRVLFDADAGVDAPPEARRVGYVPQNYALFPHLTVTGNIAYGLVERPKCERRTQVAEMVRLMRLEGMEGRRPHELSGGQQQRVALARALITGPELLLLDEPFAALDGAIRSRLQNELLTIQNRFRIPTLLVTHDLGEAYALSDRLAIIENGRVLQVGPKEEVLRRPAGRTVARLVGTKNIFDARVVESNGYGAVLNWSGYPIRIPVTGLRVGLKATFCIRPEGIAVVRPEDTPRLEPQGRDNVVAGCLVREIDRGITHTLFFKVDMSGSGDYDLEVSLPHQERSCLSVGMGQTALLSLLPGAIHVIPGADPSTQGAEETVDVAPTLRFAFDPPRA